MSSSEHVPERAADDQPPSPGASSHPTPDEAWHNSDSEDPRASTRSYRRRIREKLRERGQTLPDSPPPPGRWPTPPLARELLDAGGSFIHKRQHRRVIKHASGTKVTKFHRHGSLLVSEAEAMRFVAEHTSIPVPRVYDVGDNHLTMDFIDGERLREAWDTALSAEDKALVVRQMRDYISQLRAIKSPDGSVCHFGGRPVVDTRKFYHNEGGPFPDEAAYNEFLLEDLGGVSIIGDMIRSQLRADHEIVLTHGDLHANNILVRPGVGVVGVIDWRLAGYYPEYLELLRMFSPYDAECGYHRRLFDIFPQRYDQEFLTYQMLCLYTKKT